MKAAELREKTDEELREELVGCKRELFNLRFQWQTEEASNPAQYERLRRDVARVCTILREREFGVNADLDARAPAAPEEETSSEQQ